MPPAFKAAARTLLLAAHHSSGASAGGGGTLTRRAAAWRHAVQALGALPPAVLLHVLRLAASPASEWLPLRW